MATTTPIHRTYKWITDTEAILMSHLTGHDAIDLAETDPTVKLHKYADPTEGAAYDLTIDEARAVAADDPSLIFAWLPPSAGPLPQPTDWADQDLRTALDLIAELVDLAETYDEHGPLLQSELRFLSEHRH